MKALYLVALMIVATFTADHVSATVAHFIAVEIMVEVTMVLPVGVLAATRESAMIAVVRIVSPVDVAMKIATAMEPGSGSDEEAAVKPFGAVVAIGRTVVRGKGIVTVRADGRRADLDGNLSVRAGRADEGKCAECRDQTETFDRAHFLTSSKLE